MKESGNPRLRALLDTLLPEEGGLWLLVTTGADGRAVAVAENISKLRGLSVTWKDGARARITGVDVTIEEYPHTVRGQKGLQSVYAAVTIRGVPPVSTGAEAGDAGGTLTRRWSILWSPVDRRQVASIFSPQPMHEALLPFLELRGRDGLDPGQGVG